MSAELDWAIDGVYRAFEGYTRPRSFEGCACCWGDLADDAGATSATGTVRVPAPGGSRDLRTLESDELGVVASGVPVTAGTLDVVKHYLPRILEIAVTDGCDWPDLEVVFYRLNDDATVGCSPCTDWPLPERDALRTFYRALWLDRLGADEVDGYGVDEALCAIGVVEPELDWFLAGWLKFEQPKAAEHLLRFLQLNAQTMIHGRLWNAFWEHRAPAPQNVARIIAWTKDDSTRAAVAAAAERSRSPEESFALEECYLRWLG